MLKVILIPVLFWTVLAGPFVLLAAQAMNDRPRVEARGAACFLAGVGCNHGPVVLPAISRLGRS